MIHDKNYIKNFLFEITLLQVIIYKRAEELLRASTPLLTYPVRVSHIEFEDSYVGIHFVEDTNSDCPRDAYSELTIEDLSMEDDEWSNNIEEITERVKKRQQKEIDAEHQRQRSFKMAQYLALKSELGM